MVEFTPRLDDRKRELRRADQETPRGTLLNRLQCSARTADPGGAECHQRCTVGSF